MKNIEENDLEYSHLLMTRVGLDSCPCTNTLQRHKEKQRTEYNVFKIQPYGGVRVLSRSITVREKYDSSFIGVAII